MSKKSEKVIFRGYAKQEDDHWVSICIDLNIVTQGNSAKEAIQKNSEMIDEYIEFIFENYPEQFQKMINRPAPNEFIEEYYSIVSKSIAKTKPQTELQTMLHNYGIEPSNLEHYSAQL